MAQETSNLHLILPLGSRYWNLDTWVENMNILDKAYLDIQHTIELRLVASNVAINRTIPGLNARNAQTALDNLAARGTSIYFINVTENMTLTIPSYAYCHMTLTFGNTVPTVTFVKSIPDSHSDFEWINGQPTFEANSTYELSFLHLACIWQKRN